MISERARIALEVSKLRAAALEEEGQKRKEIIQEAIALEEKLASKEIAIAKLKLEQALLNAKVSAQKKTPLPLSKRRGPHSTPQRQRPSTIRYALKRKSPPSTRKRQRKQPSAPRKKTGGRRLL